MELSGEPWSCDGDGLGDCRSAENVVGQREPEKHGSRFGEAAHGDLAQIEAAGPSVDALGDGTALVARLAGRALHTPAPGEDALAIARARCERVASVLAPRRRTMHGDAFAMCPFDVVGVGEAAIGEVVARQAVIACAHLLQHTAG